MTLIVAPTGLSVYCQILISIFNIVIGDVASLQTGPISNAPSALENWFNRVGQRCSIVLISSVDLQWNQYNPMNKTSNAQCPGVWHFLSADMRDVNKTNLSVAGSNTTQKSIVYRLGNFCTLGLIQMSAQEDHSMDNQLRNLKSILNPEYALHIYCFAEKDNKFEMAFMNRIVKNHNVRYQVALVSEYKEDNGLAGDPGNFLCQYCTHLDVVTILPKSGYGDISIEKATEIFPDIYSNFNGMILTTICGLLAVPIQEIRQDHQTGEWAHIRGINTYLLRHLSEKHNFSIKVYPSRDGGFGSKYPNGSWGGVIRDLIEGKADVGQLLARTFGRDDAVSYSNPVDYTGLTFLTGPPVARYTWKSVYLTFTASVWRAVLVSLILAALAFDVFVKGSSRMGTPNGSKIPTRSSIELLATILLEQGKSDLGSASAIRTLITVWLVSGIVITTAYRAKLVSLISIPVLDEAAKSFDELSETSPNNVEVRLYREGGLSLKYFKTSTNAVVHKLSTRLNLEQNETKCIYFALKSSRRVCILWDVSAKYVIHRHLVGKTGEEPIDVVWHDKINVVPLGLTYPKDSLYKSIFDVTLGWAIGHGFANKWNDMDAEFLRAEGKTEAGCTQNVSCAEAAANDSDGPEKLGIKNVIGAIYILATGIIAATTTMVVEQFYANLRNVALRIVVKWCIGFK